MSAPPLNALHTFEIAARHQSYSLAAQELHVTHSAVSQQMRQLEQSLGLALFERKGRQMQLSTAGKQLLQQVQPALQQIQSALEQLRQDKSAPAIKVATLQSFATFWLLPRLGSFQKLHPELTIHIQAAIGLVNLERTKTDIAIRFGLGKWSNCDSEKILDDQLYTVCSPDFNRGHWPQNPAQLRDYRVLAVEHGREWQNWSDFAGINAQQFKHVVQLSDSNLMLTAAMSGQGIAVTRHSLVAAEIAAGKLVRLFDLIAPSDYSYYLVKPKGQAENPAILAFTNWIKKETQEFAQQSQSQLSGKVHD